MNHDPNCIFCMIVRGDAPSLKVYEDEDCLGFMDIMPQSEGHVLVIPKRHAAQIFDVSADEAAKLIRVTHELAGAVRNAMQPDGVMLAQLNGADAGQTVFHLHFHIVPRYAGQKLALHASKMGNIETLKTHCEKIRAALHDTA